MKSYTAAEVAELDRYATEDLGVDLKQLMEIAGMRSAECMTKLLSDEKKKVVCLAGHGGNGGDALVCPKRLTHRWYDVSVLLSHPLERLQATTLHQLDSWQRFAWA